MDIIIDGVWTLCNSFLKKRYDCGGKDTVMDD
jgi:hypothetical protein